MIPCITSVLMRLKADWVAQLQPEAILAACQEAGYIAWRDRVLTPVTTIQLFLLQILHGHTACSHLPHLSGIQFSASAYCQARAVGKSWYVDETYLKVQGQWQYLYRAIDRDGNLVDVRLSDTRDLAAAEAFFRSAWTVTGVAPDRITTDGHDAYPRAIRNVFGDRVTHRTNRYLNNQVEQDHRGIKQRHRPMGGFKHGKSAARFCRLFDEIRAFFRPRSRRNQVVSLTQRRDLHHDRFAQLMGMMAAV
jgi:transposase-like protein